jgi:integrase
MQKLKHLLTKAIEWGVIADHPMTESKFKMLPVPKKHQMRLAVSIHDVLDATEFCPPWLDNYVRLKILTGLRQIDMLLLTRHCMTDEGLLVTPSKTENSSAVKTLYEWTPELRKVISDIVSLPPTSVYLFKTQKGEPLVKNKATNSAFNSAWQRWMKRLKDRNIPRFSERSIRNLVGSEGELQEASERLGHASPATTKRYYRLKPTVVAPLKT